MGNKTGRVSCKLQVVSWCYYWTGDEDTGEAGLAQGLDFTLATRTRLLLTCLWPKSELCGQSSNGRWTCGKEVMAGVKRVGDC